MKTPQIRKVSDSHRASLSQTLFHKPRVHFHYTVTYTGAYIYIPYRKAFEAYPTCTNLCPSRQSVHMCTCIVRALFTVRLVYCGSQEGGWEWQLFVNVHSLFGDQYCTYGTANYGVGKTSPLPRQISKSATAWCHLGFVVYKLR